MSDITSLAVQKVSKPKIEDVFPYYLEGETLKTALDFAAYLREIKIKPTWTLHNAWKGIYKGKVIYYIRLPLYKSHFEFKGLSDTNDWENSWTFTPYLHSLHNYQDKIYDQETQERILAGLWRCNPDCERGCAPPYDKVLFGKQVRLCYGSSHGGCATWFTNPNTVELEWIKKLLELEKQARKNA